MHSIKACHLKNGRLLLLAGVFLSTVITLRGASFPGNALVEVADPTGGLSWNTNNTYLTIQCWFKLSIPSDTAISDHMTILVNRRTGGETDRSAYWIRFNPWSGNVEYIAQGASGGYTNKLIERPYLDRWYHVAVVRAAENFAGYTDGREMFNETLSPGIGSSANTDGISIGGWGSTSSKQYLFGDIQEVSISQSAWQSDWAQYFITQNMYQDQPLLPDLAGYFKLGYSTNSADQLKNFSPNPPSNTSPATVQGGAVGFEETDQSGEQSAFDSRRNGGEDAVVPLSGSFTWEQSVFTRPVPGIAFDFSIAYTSGNSQDGAKLGNYDPFAAPLLAVLGKGWRHTFETRIVPGEYFDPVGGLNVLGLMDWNGSIETWVSDEADEEYTPRHKEYRGEFSPPTLLSRCEWTTPDRLLYKFKHPYFGGNALMRGKLYEIGDFNGNKVQILLNQVVGIVTQVVDTAGGRYDFKYNGEYFLTNVSFQGWMVNFAYDSSKRLTSMTRVGPAAYSNVNTRWAFSYNTNGLLERITDPRGNTNAFVTYDKYGRKTNEVDGLGRITKTEYNIPGLRRITRTDAEGYKWIDTLDRKGRPILRRDPLANTTSYQYDDNGNIICETDPLGRKTLYAYDIRANKIAETNALGQVTRWQYHAFFNKPVQNIDPLNWSISYEYDSAGNLTRQYDALGTMVTYAYTPNGLVQASTDGNGNTARFSYTPAGFLASTTDPATNTTFYGRNELGWPTAITNALGQVTTLAYDINGRVVRTEDQLRRIFTSAYDPNGNLTSQSDGKGQLTFHSYDAEDQKIETVDRAGAVWRTTWTPRGQIATQVDPLLNTTRFFYDSADRLTNLVDALGNSQSYQVIILKLWKLLFHRENRSI